MGVIMACLAAPGGLPAAALAAHNADSAAPGEYEIKAAFVYNFTLLVRWPDVAEAGPPLRVGILGPGTVLDVFRQVIGGRESQGRTLQVSRVIDPGKIGDCDLVFVARDDSVNAIAVIRAARGRPILTVGETAEFLNDGGMVSFRVQDRRIRFDVNLEPTRTAQLDVSSKLLRVAGEVRTQTSRREEP